MKKRHRNALDSEEPQHLYAIHDRKREDVYKYGISRVILLARTACRTGCATRLIYST